MKSDTTVIIPVKDETKYLRDMVTRSKKYGYSVLVPIAKNSSEPANICKELDVGYFFDSGGGKGVALREALKRVKTKYSVFIDADGSHRIEDVKKISDLLGKENADLVIASRLMGGSMELYDGTWESFFRSFFTLCINQIINVRFGSRITDTQNGFRGGKTASLSSLNLKSSKFEVETEMVMKMLKRKMKIMEIPSREEKRGEGKSGISIIRHGWRYIWTVFSNLF